MFQDVLKKLWNNEDLTAEETYSIIEDICRDTLSEVQTDGFQTSLLMKGPTITEITAIAQAMQDNCKAIAPRVDEELLDTCGTGEGLSTFNISTATALVAAAAGIRVAQHGNRSNSGYSGSADVMEALGVEINLSARGVEKLIEEVGIAFIYEPLFNPMVHKILLPVQALSINTIYYTIIGPLINPARATQHILGVYKPELLDVVTEIALSLGYTRGMFVHGLDGLDAISLIGKTRINEIKDGSITSYEIAPEDFGLNRCSPADITTNTPDESAEVILDVFSGRNRGPYRQAILINAAGALLIGSKAASFNEGIQLAGELIDSGAVQRKLEHLIVVSRSCRALPCAWG